MTSELMFLTWTLILAVVQILLVASLRTRECGLAYNAGPRDVPSRTPPGIVTARLMRAQTNLFETLPIFIGAVLICNAAHLHTAMTYWGAGLYFWSRLLYVPLYAAGISYIRSVVWGISLLGILMLLVSILRATGAM